VGGGGGGPGLDFLNIISGKFNDLNMAILKEKHSLKYGDLRPLIPKKTFV
jgi:hypothetical protein